MIGYLLYVSVIIHYLTSLELTLFSAQALAVWLLRYCTQHYETSVLSPPETLAETHTCNHQHRYTHMNINATKDTV